MNIKKNKMEEILISTQHYANSITEVYLTEDKKTVIQKKCLYSSCGEYRYDIDELRMSRGTSVFSLKAQKGHTSADKLTSTFDDMRKAQQKSSEGYKQLFEEIRKINEIK